jgi:hypothetical protein
VIAVIVGAVTVLAWAPLAFYANRYNIDFSAVAFPSAATILAFLLAGAGQVGRYIADEIEASADQVQELSEKADTAKDAAAAAAKVAGAKPGDAAAAAEAETTAGNAQTAKQEYEDVKAETKSEMDKIFFAANWLRTGLLYAFISVPVSAVALVVGSTQQNHSSTDWRAIVGSAAVALLVGTGVGLLPMTWRLLGLKLYRNWSDRAFT